MKNCFECDNEAKHMHHIIPKILGGLKMVPLCEKCHGIIHNINFVNHGKLVKEGLKKAKESGVILGRKRTRDSIRIIELLKEGLSQRKIAQVVGCSKTTVMREYRELREAEKENTIKDMKKWGF